MPHGSLERIRIRDVPPLDVWIRTCYDQSVSQHWNSGILYAPPFFRKGRTIAVNGDHHYVCRLTAQEALRDNTLIKLELRNCTAVSPTGRTYAYLHFNIRILFTRQFASTVVPENFRVHGLRQRDQL